MEAEAEKLKVLQSEVEMQMGESMGETVPAGQPQFPTPKKRLTPIIDQFMLARSIIPPLPKN